MRLDAHQHFWKFDPLRDSWITPEMEVIRKDFLPSDLSPLLKESCIDGCVAVQADQTEAETHFLVHHARQNEFIKGVVGWVDLKSDQLSEHLTNFASIPQIKGFRHIVQAEPPGFLVEKKFLAGVHQLEAHGFTYDLLVYPHQLEEAFSFIRQLPHQPIVIDHLAKPYIKNGEIAVWKQQLAACASFENVWCKLSGLVTEADWKNWKPHELTPYLEVALECFGPNRLMFGSDWPVCLVAASYQRVVSNIEDFIAALSSEEKRNIMGENAVRFYNL
jgi:L-fuconolactonase